MRIAVVGGGISGLTAAYYLSRAHDVDLFDRNSWAGGHSRTIPTQLDGTAVGLDIGFMVYNEASYPGFVALLRELGVRTQPSDMSLSVACTACRLEYSSRGLTGWLARPSNALRPGMLRLGFDIMRFYRDAVRSLSNPSLASLSLHEYLTLRRYSGAFRRHFVTPLLAAVWSTPPALVASFPAQYFLRFIHNHGLVGAGEFRWRTVSGGSKSYVEKLLAASRFRCELERPVRAVRRGARCVEVRLADDEARQYDRVVLACHSDEALAVLCDADEEERRALESFTYVPNSVVLHTDRRLLPARRGAWASWNYATNDCRRADTPLSVTYHLNRIQAIESETQFCVTLNARDRIDPPAILHETDLSHPRYTFETLDGQRRLSRLNGKRNTLYAGAYMGYGFHEDGFEAGRAAAALLGAVD